MRLQHKTRHIDFKRKSKSCMTTQIKTEKIFKKYIRLVKDKRKNENFQLYSKIQIRKINRVLKSVVSILS